MMEKEGTGREGTNFFEDNIDSDDNKEGGGGIVLVFEALVCQGQE